MSTTTTTTTPAADELDLKLHKRIASCLETVRAWDSDTELLQKCRDSLPIETLLDEITDENYARHGESNALMFLKRLCVHFKNSMTWVNNPPCHNCGNKDTQHKGVREAETDEEKQGQASRVELYDCPSCGATTTFPRYNKVSKLFETKQGRCGEYANLFGLVCRSVGFETRYIHDVTDHVWVECFIHDLDSWVMADGCEGVIDEYGMYESGWGKQLTCMIGVATDHVVDVTPKYTRKWNDTELQTRRRQVVSSSEQVLQQMIQTFNDKIKSTVLSGKAHKNRLEELQRREEIETRFITNCRQSYEWNEEEKYGIGRISGSLQWKMSRSEAGQKNATNEKEGNNNNNTTDNNTSAPTSFFVESFYCTDTKQHQSSKVSIVVQSPHSKRQRQERYDAIIVNDCPCAVETESGGRRNQIISTSTNISMVVLDETHLGCILLSRSFPSLQDLGRFVDRLSTHRIVILQGRLEQQQGDDNNETTTSTTTATLDDATRKQLSRLGGLDCDFIMKEGSILYIGQVVKETTKSHPKWTLCSSFDSCKNGTIQVQLENKKQNGAMKLEDDFKLRTELNTKPSSIVGRVPEAIMPYQTQLLAGEEQKRTAFFNFIKQQQQQQSHCNYIGYTTKPNAPIYLLDASAYPFKRVNNSKSTTDNNSENNSWNTFHFLPAPLVSKDDVGIITKSNAKDDNEISIPKVDIPLESMFFTQLLGNQLLKDSNSPAIGTEQALHNSRLIALYFSAHWCPPCKRFTPMLIEMYLHLKEVCPTHGLEIVFVSSDRDAQSFQHYYGTMPWLSIPFFPGNPMIQLISQRYGVRGIPSLVVLDAMSGQIVASTSESRNQVTQACHGGEDQIERLLKTWLAAIPQDSKDMISMLEVSCVEDTIESTGKQDDDDDVHAQYATSYLFRAEEENTLVDSKARFMEIWTQLVEKDGMDKNQAAAKAIELVTKEQKEKEAEDESPLVVVENGTSSIDKNTIEKAAKNVIEWNDNTTDALVSILTTACKYLENAKREPWTSKFRIFKCSNKFADRGIIKFQGGIQLLKCLGLDIYETADQDFFVSIPLQANMNTIHSNVMHLLDQHKNKTDE